MANKLPLLGVLLIVMVPQNSHNQFTPLNDFAQGCRLESSGVSGACLGSITCKNTIDNIFVIMNGWSCINRRRHNYYDYSQPAYETNYKLQVYLTNIITDVGWNSLESYASHIYKLSLTGGNQKSVPRAISAMHNIIELELTFNEIEAFATHEFVTNQQQMTKMNLSHNAITTVNTDLSYITEQHSLITLDLSYNYIELLAGNIFARFPKIQYLDLSHNNIKTTDMSTFAGMTDLTTLNISYNKLTTIGHTFIRFINLNQLSIEHNQITELLETNLISMVKLEKLNISYNNIGKIDDYAFRSLALLSSLDVSHNQIRIIKETLLQNATNLQTLLLADNNIETIENGAFEQNRVTKFSIENNRMVNTISKNTFAGLKVANLTLCAGQIHKLDDLAFSNLSDSLISLNLSSNAINNISSTAFKSLKRLSILDLSNNKIRELNFDTSDLNQLTVFYAQNNSITKMLKSMFGHLLLLEELDLSHNVINEIEPNTFDSLSNLKKLLLNDNELVSAIDANKFRGLIGVNRISFTNTKLTSYKNETFSNMTSLTIFISSHGQLANVEYNAFLATGSIINMDLSYNVLQDFSINTTTISMLNSLYLNDNRLRNITNSTFFGLKSLQTLNLSNNDIIHLESTSFQSLSSLLHLYLFSNLDLDLPCNVFDNLTLLEEVDLSNIRRHFNFINATNSSMSKLILSQHFLENINDVFVFHIKNVGNLDLSSNKFTYVDKFSFQTMDMLTWLDLSNNLITDIQPGSFSHTNMINELNLHGNNLQSIQYGALDGLRNLRVLNLSDNALHSFEASVLHSTPRLQILSLDNNAIRSIVFFEFRTVPLKLIYVGGNGIPCNSLVKIKIGMPFEFNVTAEKLDFTNENVNGITCKANVNDFINEAYSNNSGGNFTWLFRGLAKSVVELQETIKTVANNTAQKENILTNTLVDVAKSVNVLATSYNKSQIASEKNFNMFIRALDELESKNRSSILLNTSNTGFAAEGNVALRSTLKEMLLSFQDDAREDTNGFKDIKVLLHIIAVCMVLTLVIVSGYILYIYVIKNSKIRVLSSQCTQPIANAMEMD